MNKVEKYEHHGEEVSVFSELKGQHREHCLCMVCKKLKIGDAENNCPIAQAVFENYVKFNLCTPMFECPKFDADEEKLEASPRISLEEGERVTKMVELELDLDNDTQEKMLELARSSIVNDREVLLAYAAERALTEIANLSNQEIAKLAKKLKD